MDDALAGSGRVAGKVALVTGAARGQGRAEAVMLAAEGADVIGVDVCAPMPYVSYEAPIPEDLAETGRQVEGHDRRFVAAQVDVRDYEALEAAVADGAAALGGIDIVVANAGISTWGQIWELTPDQWRVMIDINLTGVWNTLRVSIPTMIEQRRGGSIIVTSSVGGLKALPGQSHYVAAKHGLVGLTRTAAVELGPHGIRVNSIHPWGVQTPMSEGMAYLGGLLESNPHYAASYSSILTDPPIASPEDIARSVVFLASDDSRCITGAHLPVDMGATKV